MKSTLQWGGRFDSEPDKELIAFGSSLEDDLVLAPFDVQCSRAHAVALRGGKIITQAQADQLADALDRIAAEIAGGEFADYAHASGAEDIHGAIDARVRDLAPDAGGYLHAGRSRNDQVATTLLLYAADRADRGAQQVHAIISALLDRAENELQAQTLLAGMTHWQPAQPILLAFWLAAGAEAFTRDAERFKGVAAAAKMFCPLGSGALAGSSLPLERKVACAMLGFAQPSRNALDAIGNRDVALDTAHAFARSLVTASRICEELILWCSPGVAYARLADAAATGSSLMPQKRNPDPFELVRATSADLAGRYSGALFSTSGLALSYHRDLQVTKAAVVAIIERAIAALRAFERALSYVEFNRDRMNETAAAHFTVATDIADGLIAAGISAREAHALVGAVVSRAESQGRMLDQSDLHDLQQRANIEMLDAPLDARTSVSAKKTLGSTHPDEVARNIETLRRELSA